MGAYNYENGEDYQEKDNSIIEVKVFDNKTGNEIKDCCVTLFLSKIGSCNYWLR